MMKKMMMIGAIGTFAALAACAEFPGDGIEKQLIRTNVGCGGGITAPGFLLTRGEIERFVIAGAPAECAASGANVLPANVHPFDLDEVLAYLTSIDETNVRPVLRNSRGCSITRADRDPDGGGECFADDGLEGSVGASGETRKRDRW